MLYITCECHSIELLKNISMPVGNKLASSRADRSDASPKASEAGGAMMCCCVCSCTTYMHSNHSSLTVHLMTCCVTINKEFSLSLNPFSTKLITWFNHILFMTSDWHHTSTMCSRWHVFFLQASCGSVFVLTNHLSCNESHTVYVFVGVTSCPY